jgi:hypothetical protein
LEDIRAVGKKLARHAELWLGASPELDISPQLVGVHWLILRNFVELENRLKTLGARF